LPPPVIPRSAVATRDPWRTPRSRTRPVPRGSSGAVPPHTGFAHATAFDCSRSQLKAFYLPVRRTPPNPANQIHLFFHLLALSLDVGCWMVEVRCSGPVAPL